MSRALRWALALSVLAHLAFLIATHGLAFLDGREEPESEVLHATLIAPPPPAKPQKMPRATPSPRPVPPVAATPAPTPAPAAAAPPTAPASAPVAAPVAVPAGAPAEPPAVAVPARALPVSGHIRYSVSKGEQGFVLGRSVHEWLVDGDRYSIKSTTETTGLVSLFADVKLSQTSRGWITPQGLKPLEFRDQRKGGRYRADFDWERSSVVLGDDQSVPVAAGTQDLLSMLYQFALYPLDGPEVSVMVTNGRRVENYLFRIEADASVRIGDNDVPAYHLSYRGADGGVEVWLARDSDRLPVKIRYIDRNGGISQLLADDISFQGMK